MTTQSYEFLETPRFHRPTPTQVNVPVEWGGALVLEEILRQFFRNAAHLLLQCSHRFHLGKMGSHEPGESDAIRALKPDAVVTDVPMGYAQTVELGKLGYQDFR